MNEKAPHTILLIEDEEPLIEALNLKLTHEGFRVVAATRADDGMHVLESEPDVSLILLDLMLPGASGFDVLEGLKANQKTKHIPVVILSNLGQREEIERGKKLGAQDFIIKSDVRLEDIVRKVRSILDTPSQ